MLYKIQRSHYSIRKSRLLMHLQNRSAFVCQNNKKIYVFWGGWDCYCYCQQIASCELARAAADTNNSELSTSMAARFHFVKS